MQFNKGSGDRSVLTSPFKLLQSPSPTTYSSQLFQQSVTLRAFMEGSPTSGTVTDTGWFIWGITEAQLPILVGAAAGGFVLMLTLLGLVVWRCCQHQKDKEKQYCFQKSVEEIERRPPNNNSLKSRTSNDSVVFIGTTRSVCTSHLKPQDDDEETGRTSNCISRSQSAPLKGKELCNSSLKATMPKRRPHSQPLRYSSTDITFAPHLHHAQQHTYPQRHTLDGQLPGIPEIRLLSTETLDSESQSSSYSAYDFPFPQHHLQIDPNSATLKTRSLPTWVRSRPRPLSTEDDLNELYAKVNFNKKRKNRMRNDSAAAIALNKSRSQFIHFAFMHKDTDSLVDNEAVVVYDERTAL